MGRLKVQDCVIGRGIKRFGHRERGSAADSRMSEGPVYHPQCQFRVIHTCLFESNVDSQEEEELMAHVSAGAV